MASSLSYLSPGAMSPSQSRAGSRVGSQTGSPRSSAGRKPTSTDFAAQIRRLELEGERLRQNSKFIPSSSGSVLGSGSFISGEMEVSPEAAPLSSSSLGALADISSETKTIDQLRIQLENQKRDTEHLHKKLLTGSRGSPLRTSSVLDFNLPSATSSVSRRPLDVPSTTRNYSYLSQSHLERALQQSQETVQDLRRRIVQANEECENHQRQYKNTVEELKGQLKETVAGRDSLMEMRQKEATCQDALVKKLQNTLQQLHKTNEDQEQTINDLNSRLEGQQQEMMSLDGTINQLRTVLTDVERRRGRAFYDTDPAPHQAPSMLLHTLEKMIQEYEDERVRKESKVNQLESDLEEVKKSSSTRNQDLISQHQERLQSVADEHEKQLEAAAERAANARKQSSGLQSQVAMLQDQLANLEKIKDEEIKVLETKVEESRCEAEKDRQGWRDKRSGLEFGLDQVQRELTEMRSERDEAIRNMAAWETRVAHYETSIERLENELEYERTEQRRLIEKDDENKQKCSDLEIQLKDKEHEVKRLERMIDDVRSECELQLRKEVSSVEKTEKLKADDKISILTTELNDLKESYRRTTSELQSTQTELLTLKDRYEELRLKQEGSEVRAGEFLLEKNNLAVQLQEKKMELQKACDDRDYYLRTLDETSEEHTRLKLENDKLAVMLDEKDRALMKIRQKSESLSEEVEINSRQTGDLREENERLTQVNRDHATQLEETRVAKETALKKLKQRDKQMKDVGLEKERLLNEVKEKTDEVDGVTRERDRIYLELKDSRYEVARLTEEKDSLKRLLSGQEGDQEKERNRLMSKLKDTEHDLRLARKAIKSRESVDDKAMKVADKMQKDLTSKRAEVDSLQTKVSWLEECLDTAKRDVRALKADNERLSSALQEVKQRSNDSSQELEEYMSRNKDLREKIVRLETALEKAAVKHAASQDQLEIKQQEIAQLKLKHQLELKEFERTNQMAAARNLPSEPIRTNSGNPGNYSIDEVPVSQKPVGPSQNGVNPPAVVGEELRAMLNEVKELIVGQNIRSKSDKTGSSRGSRDSSRDRASSKLASENLSEPEVDRPSRVRVKGKSRKHKQENVPSFPHSRIPPLWTSSPTPTPSVASTSKHGTRCRSPVEDLLSNNSARSSESVPVSRSHTSSVSHYTEDGARGASHRVSSDAQLLCKRLEDKLESLSRMGGNLQKENKEMADLIKEQGSRLRKVRESGRHSHRQHRQRSSSAKRS